MVADAMPVNPWRSEAKAQLSFGDIPLRCRMDTLALLFQATGASTIPDLYRAWDSLNPAKLQPCFRLLAESPDIADKAWPRCAGVRDMAALQAAFYRVTSGNDPDKIAEEEATEKKVGGAIVLMMAREVATLSSPSGAGLKSPEDTSDGARTSSGPLPQSTSSPHGEDSGSDTAQPNPKE